MLTTFGFLVLCGELLNENCPSCLRNGGRVALALKIGRLLMESGTFFGPVVNGKQFIKIGLVYPAVFCMKDFKHGRKLVSGIELCVVCFAFMRENGGSNGNGNRLTVNQFHLLWAERKLAQAQLIEQNEVRRFIFWLINAVRHYRLILPVRIGMISGRLMI